MALGELIEEGRGRITGQRVLDVEGPKIETSQKLEGKFGGIDGSDLGTYCTVMRKGEEGTMYGEGQGVITSTDGQGMATWTGQGVGRFLSPGKISFRGSVFYRTDPTSGGKLSSLNNKVGVFEYEVDEEGNCSVNVWEWK
jgi:predicted nucleic acid-binding Zn ribbon protein